MSANPHRFRAGVPGAMNISLDAAPTNQTFAGVRSFSQGKLVPWNLFQNRVREQWLFHLPFSDLYLDYFDVGRARDIVRGPVPAGQEYTSHGWLTPLKSRST